MADTAPSLPPVSAEHRRIAASQFEHARQALAKGNYDYGIQLLRACCRLDPANLPYRQALRQAERAKYGNKPRRSPLATMTSAGSRLRLRQALLRGDYLAALEHAEDILLKNPWDVGAHLALGQAFAALQQLDLAVWSVEQARQVHPKSPKVLRVLAQLYEKRGNFHQAAILWEMVRRADPKDVEAQHKAKDLAASETIVRGRYEEALLGTQEQATAQTAEHDSPREPASTPARAATPSGDRFARQIAAWQEKIAAQPGNPQPYLQLAGFYRQLRRFEDARKLLEQGLTATGNHFELACELADLDIEPLRADLALAEEKLRGNPADAELQTLRNRLEREILQRELDLYRRKAERYPTDMSYRLEMGIRLLRLGQVEEAIHELQAARVDPRQQWRALLYLGYSFKVRKNWRLAQRNFEEALKCLPASESLLRKELLFELAHGHAEAGNYEQAVELAYELANLDFGYRQIGKLLDDWQSRLAPSSRRPS